jgi:hypothetical protein
MSRFCLGVPFATLLAALGAALPGQDANRLLGTWRSAADAGKEERITFRTDRTLVLDGCSLRYAVDGERLSLTGESGTLNGSWRIRGDELTVTLEVPGEGERTERYRREAEHAKLRTGRVELEVPAGWTVTRETPVAALLNPGLAPTDTLDALVIVFHGPLGEAERRKELAQLVRARLPALAAELRGQAIECDFADVEPRRVAIASGDGVVVTAKGRAGGGRDVRIWLGATRDKDAFAAVLGVVVAARSGDYVPALRHAHETLRFTKAADAGAQGAPLAGGEFGHSSFGSGGNSLSTVYAFDATGAVARRTMFSSSIGGSDSSRRGTWTTDGDVVRMTFSDGVTTARALVEGGRVTALQIGGARYARM